MSIPTISKAIQLLSPKKSEVFFYGFLPDNNKEYFDDGSGKDKNKKIKQDGDQSLTGSIDTSSIDYFRQGVEITRSKHYFAGIVKIHSGEPGHVIKKNSYGIDKNYFIENYYKDLEYYNPVSYLNSEKTITYPLVTSDNFETENYNFNGVIEPFPIRSVASMFTINFPFEPHSIKGMLMNGNSNTMMASDKVLTVYKKYTKYKIKPWLDMADMLGEINSILPVFNDDKTFLDPFNDTPSKIQLSTNLSQDMIERVRMMSGSTENYISENNISATAGWVYNDAWPKGTDSIAFGGFSY